MLYSIAYTRLIIRIPYIIFDRIFVMMQVDLNKIIFEIGSMLKLDVTMTFSSDRI